jgi:hypothetical protein
MKTPLRTFRSITSVLDARFEGRELVEGELEEASLPDERQQILDALAAELKKRPEFTSVKQQGGKLTAKVNPGMNPAVASVEFWDLGKPVAKWKYVLHDGQSGWGWNEVPRVQKFDSPHNTLKFEFFQRDVAQLGMAVAVEQFVSLYVVKGLEDTGLVWTNIDKPGLPKKLVTQDQWKAEKEAGAAAEKAKAEKAKADAAAAKAAAEKAAAEKAAQKKSGVSPVEDVVSALKGRKTKTGGRLKLQEFDSLYATFEPEFRERLDHYGTSYDDDGNEQEGWDSEGWGEDYAGPLTDEVEKLLKDAGVTGWFVDIGDKGHVDVSRAP